jgi:glycosyltransferase involved in cell wall biosynthesis
MIALHTLKHLIEKKIDASLCIAGTGDQEAIARKRCNELGISQFVEWKGCVSDVASFFDSLDLLLVPSIREPLGLVAIEAAARGVPVVASLVDGLPEAICHEKTGLCLPPTLPIKNSTLLPSLAGLPDLVVDPQQLGLVPPKLLDPLHCAEEIIALSNDPQRYATMSANSLAHATSRADFAGYSQQIQALLERKDIPETDILS